MMLKNRNTPITDMISAMTSEGRERRKSLISCSSLSLCHYSTVPISIATVPSPVRNSPIVRGVCSRRN